MFSRTSARPSSAPKPSAPPQRNSFHFQAAQEDAGYGVAFDPEEMVDEYGEPLPQPSPSGSGNLFSKQRVGAPSAAPSSAPSWAQSASAPSWAQRGKPINAGGRPTGGIPAAHSVAPPVSRFGGGAQPFRPAPGAGMAPRGYSLPAPVPRATIEYPEMSIWQGVVVFSEENYDKRERMKQDRMYEWVYEILSIDERSKVLVFVDQKKFAEEVCNKLREEGYKAGLVHGGQGNPTRLAALSAFREDGEDPEALNVLVTTDVYGETIELPTATHMMNYNMCEMQKYVNRSRGLVPGPEGEPGQLLTLFEYDGSWPKLPESLIGVLEACKQEVPEELRQIADDVANGRLGKKKGATKRKSEWVCEPTDSNFFDKSICRFHGTAIGCVNAKNCRFSHSSPLGVPECYEHVKGSCTFGDKCMFRHILDDEVIPDDDAQWEAPEAPPAPAEEPEEEESSLLSRLNATKRLALRMASGYAGLGK